MSTQQTNHAHALIQALGGPTRVAELLGYDKRSGGVQRVANWARRGQIPPRVQLDHPHIFAAKGHESKQPVDDETGAAVNSGEVHTPEPSHG